MARLTTLALVLAAAATVSTAARQTVQIGLATPAPDNSEWHNGLREWRETVQLTTGNRVTIRLYAGGSLGSEKATIDRMMMPGGAVNAALLTAVGLSNIDDAFNVFGLPFFFESDEEMRHVREALTPMLARKLEARGFHLLGWGEGGWVQLFSKKAIRTLADLKRVKLYTSEGNDKMVQWYKSNGFTPIAMPETQIIPQLSSINGIEAVPMPPYPASVLGLTRWTPYMLEIRVAPLIGAAIVTTDVWSGLSPHDREALSTAAAAFEARISKAVPALDSGSIAEMQKEGRDLTVIRLDTEAAAEFRREAEKLTATVRGTIVPADVFDAARSARDAFRAARQ